MTSSKYRTTITVLLLCVVALSACAAGDPMYAAETPAGFWSGVWHGIIGVITLIIRAFGGDVAVYEVANNGGWYDFGFLCGAGGIAGSATKSASRR